MLRAAVIVFVFISTGIVLPSRLPQAPVKRHKPRELCPGATHFYSGPAPAWAKGKRVVCRIGHHVFLADH